MAIVCVLVPPRLLAYERDTHYYAPFVLADFDGAKTFVEIPRPADPRLDPNGRPRRIEQDGSYSDVEKTAKFDLA